MHSSQRTSSFSVCYYSENVMGYLHIIYYTGGWGLGIPIFNKTFHLGAEAYTESSWTPTTRSDSEYVIQSDKPHCSILDIYLEANSCPSTANFDRKFASEEESLLREFDDELSDDWTEVTSRNHFFKSEKQIWEKVTPWLNLWIINFM